MSRIPPWAKRRMGPSPDPAAQLADFAIEVIDKIRASLDDKTATIATTTLREKLRSFDDLDPYLEQVYERLLRHYADDGASLIREDEVIVGIQIGR